MKTFLTFKDNRPGFMSVVCSIITCEDRLLWYKLVKRERRGCHQPKCMFTLFFKIIFKTFQTILIVKNRKTVTTDALHGKYKIQVLLKIF